MTTRPDRFVQKPGGRIAIADIVSDEDVPQALKADPELWSGCISGAFQELDFLRRLEAGEAVVYRGPWKHVEDDDGHIVTSKGESCC